MGVRLQLARLWGLMAKLSREEPPADGRAMPANTYFRGDGHGGRFQAACCQFQGWRGLLPVSKAPPCCFPTHLARQCRLCLPHGLASRKKKSQLLVHDLARPSTSNSGRFSPEDVQLLIDCMARPSTSNSGRWTPGNFTLLVDAMATPSTSNSDRFAPEKKKQKKKKARNSQMWLGGFARPATSNSGRLPPEKYLLLAGLTNTLNSWSMARPGQCLNSIRSSAKDLSFPLVVIAFHQKAFNNNRGIDAIGAILILVMYQQ